MNEKAKPISQIEADILKLELRLDEGINSLIASYNPQKRNEEVLAEREQEEIMFKNYLYGLVDYNRSKNIKKSFDPVKWNRICRLLEEEE